MRIILILVIFVLCCYSTSTHKHTSDETHVFSRHSTVRGHHHDPGNVVDDSDSMVKKWVVGFTGGHYENNVMCRTNVHDFAEMIEGKLDNHKFTLLGPHEQHHRAEHCGDGAVFESDADDASLLRALHTAASYPIWGVDWYERQHVRQRQRRVTSQLLADFRREPLWRLQWHLHNKDEADSDYWTRVGLAPDHLHVIDAWTKGDVLGRGVTVAVVDDGLDMENPEFAECYDSLHSYDFDEDNYNPQPYVRDSHGTEAAALISARANGVCGIGVAPGSTLAAIRLIADPVSDSIEARGLTYFDEAIDIYSNSWGPADDGRRLDAPGPVTQQAMQRAVDQGRHGLGVVYVWAAGNGKQQLDSCNYDGFANSRLVVPVGAVDFMGRETEYSEWCSALLVCAPSSGSRGPDQAHGIATATLHVPYSSSGCVTDFGGTSAAAPMVAGVVALMLEARPQLGWRDVQHVLARSTVKNDPFHPSWMLNAAGFSVSHSYGFGVVNASAAVSLARTWKLVASNKDVPPCLPQTSAVLPHAIDEMFLTVGSTFEFSVEDDNMVEFVELYFTMTHPRRGDIEARLDSPAGTPSELAWPHMDVNENFDNWRFGSRIPYAEEAKGTWKLHVRDALPNGKIGTVDDVCLRVYTYSK